MTRTILRTCEHLDLNDTEEPNGARSTCSCPRRRASTFKGLSACFRGRFALADTSVVASALTSDPLLASSDTDYLPSESIGALCTLTRHTLAPSVCVPRARESRTFSIRSGRRNRARRGAAWFLFRIECLRSEVEMEKTRAKNYHGDPLLHISHIRKHINTEVNINCFLHKYIFQKYNFTRKWLYKKDKLRIYIRS